MSRSSRSLSLVALLSLSCARPAAPRALEPAAAPALDEIRASLRAHSAHRFDSAAQNRGCPEEQSLGEYMNTLVTNTAPSDADDDIRRFTGTCEPAPSWNAMPLDPPRDPAYWQCRVDAYSSDRAGDSPWHYELRFRVRRADRAIDLGNLACPGGS